jgi:hypothetical protein
MVYARFRYKDWWWFEQVAEVCFLFTGGTRGIMSCDRYNTW